jgi:hypothetical protein
MMTKPVKRVRCAVYTQVSTEYGLDQEFNSLDARQEAAEAYIRSQAHDGWTLIRTRYEGARVTGHLPFGNGRRLIELVDASLRRMPISDAVMLLPMDQPSSGVDIVTPSP